MPPGSTPQTSTTRGSSPISSFASRRAASTLVSPGSSRPPGKQTSPLWDLQSKCPPCEEQGRFTIFDAERNHYSRVDLKLLHSFRHTYTCKNLHCFVFHSFVKHAFDARCHWMRCSRTSYQFASSVDQWSDHLLSVPFLEIILSSALGLSALLIGYLWFWMFIAHFPEQIFYFTEA